MKRKLGLRASVGFLAMLMIFVSTACVPGAEVPNSASEPVSSEISEENTKRDDGTTTSYRLGSRVYLISPTDVVTVPEFTPSVEAYQINEDLSNIANADRLHLQDAMLDKLVKNNFVVIDSRANEFFDLYEMNRYTQFPSFITTDSMMHTYHLYFVKLLKSTEINYLSADVTSMSSRMLEVSCQQYEELKGTEWEEAAKRNVAFFGVGAFLMDESTVIPDYVTEIVDVETANILAAEGPENSALDNKTEDYSQYKPRGYYEGNEALEKYFRTMMWYGRRHFKQDDEVMNRCALLMSIGLKDDAAMAWEEVYAITSFFAGASDDSGVYEYLPIIEEAYGADVSCETLSQNEEAFQTYCQEISKLDPPKINSLLQEEGETSSDVPAKGFRFMGQRFSVDASIFTQLCYSNVLENTQGEFRMMPDAMDVPAAFGSDTALSILETNGNLEYNGYKEQMAKIRNDIESAPSTFWSGSLYGGWMNTLRPLLEEKGDGYPVFMQGEEWNKKNLETFLSSYTELKHDTILYSKQFVAEMGGDDEILDDRGYVEPEVELYARLSALAQNTASGLERFGVISDLDKENLAKLSELSRRLMEISVKELNGETITEEDYELIRCYGGNLEHFWAEAVKESKEQSEDGSEQFPAALVADIATGPDGLILEEAIGGVSTIYVAVPIDDKLVVAKGGTFSYYQFVQTDSNRMTDSEWRQKLGMELNENSEFVEDSSIIQPEWTQSYRSRWSYEDN